MMVSAPDNEKKKKKRINKKAECLSLFAIFMIMLIRFNMGYQIFCLIRT